MNVKKLGLWLAICLAAVMLLEPMTALAIDDGHTSTYTYNYDYWGDVRESPDAYRVDQVIYSGTLGLETPMRTPVKEPGPRATAIRSTSFRGTLQPFSRFSARGNRVSEWVRPQFCR